MTIKRDIQFGAHDILDEQVFAPKQVKVRITTFIDEDILLKLKSYAKQSGTKYQTALNALLRSFFDKPDRASKVQGLSEARVRRIVQEEIKKRA